MLNTVLDITDAEFEQIRDIMYDASGVFLKPTKKALVVTRLRSRLKELNLETFKQYVQHLKNPSTGEINYFINAITTNETFFFRHIKQFDHLKNVVLKKAIEERRPIHCWSGACSTGEEPYSLAMLFNELNTANPSFSFSLIASDINSEVLEFAKKGVYSERSVRETPKEMVNKYLTSKPSEKNPLTNEYYVSDKVKSRVKFVKHNLKEQFKQGPFDVIFLRNVIIYFDKESKQKIVSNVEKALKPGGYLYISLSENLHDITTELKYLETSVYQKV